MLLMEFEQTNGRRSSERDWFGKCATSPSFEPERHEYRRETSSTDRLAYIHAAINKSRWILDLKENWDEEGAEPYAEETWKRATDLLITYAERALSNYGMEISAPAISPGPDGSIDLHWNARDHGFDLLLNVRKKGDPAGAAGFYGCNDSGTEIKGTFDPDTFNKGLLDWLIP